MAQVSRPVKIVGNMPQHVDVVEPIEQSRDNGGNRDNGGSRDNFYVKTILTQGVEKLPLINDPYHFSFPGLVRIATLADESSLLHAIANALYLNYRQGMYNDGTKVSQTDWVKTLRKDLAAALTEKHPSSNGKSSYYDSLSLAKDYKLEDIVNYFNSNKVLNLDFLEYICQFLKADIYVIDLVTMKVINTDIDQYSHYDGNKTSIVIGLIDLIESKSNLPIYHFETIAVEVTMRKYPMPFKPDNPLIIKIKQQLGLCD